MNGPQNAAQGAVTVVVIGYNDAGLIGDAVRSALAQGPAVAEVIAVDDHSCDGTAQVLQELAQTAPRLRVLRRAENSGGCGTPRNDGIRAATTPYVMFLDSDDVLPPGAVDRLLAAAREHGAPVAAGQCVRRELPEGRQTPWRPELYARAAVVEQPADEPRLVDDTLCVNKLYATDFLREHAITFPDGRFTYEDFVFTARVLAARPRVALIPDPVYVWHVRRAAKRLSISLDRAGIDNWRSRIEAHREVVRIHTDAGEKALVRASRAGFLERSVRMYARELGGRGERYRTEWWEATREYLAGFEDADVDAAPVAAAVLARVVLAAAQPVDVERIAALCARPARLLPPYPPEEVWSASLPVPLGELVAELPVTVVGLLRPGALGTRLRLRVHDLYGRLAAAGPTEVEVELVDRRSGRAGQTRTARLAQDQGGGWTAEAALELGALAPRGHQLAVWDVRVAVRCADGRTLRTAVQAAPGGSRRTAVPSRRGGALLAHPHATADGALALRVAPALRGAVGVLRRRLGGRR